jgi:hypothetical protein
LVLRKVDVVLQKMDAGLQPARPRARSMEKVDEAEHPPSVESASASSHARQQRRRAAAPLERETTREARPGQRWRQVTRQVEERTRQVGAMFLFWKDEIAFPSLAHP